MATTPGSSLPSRNSSEAPPPVDTQSIRSASPSSCTARTESPPPTTVCPSERSHGLRDRLRPLRKPGPLEDPHRAIPEHGSRPRDLRGERLARVRAHVQPEPAVGNRIGRHDLRVRVGLEGRSRDHVHRKQDLVAGLDLLRHLPADEHCVRPLGEGLQDSDLVLDLRPAEHGDERPRRFLQERAQLLQLALQQQAGIRREQMRDRLRGCMCAMRGAERVVDVEVASVGQLARELRVVLRLARMEARVLENGDARIVHERAQMLFDRLQREGRVLPFGRPRCEQRRSFCTPPSRRSRIVGSAARIRVSSATRPFSSGTLKSTRARTVLPETSASRTERGRCTATEGAATGPRAGSCSPTRCRTTRTP